MAWTIWSDACLLDQITYVIFYSKTLTKNLCLRDLFSQYSKKDIEINFRLITNINPTDSTSSCRKTKKIIIILKSYLHIVPQRDNRFRLKKNSRSGKILVEKVFGYIYMYVSSSFFFHLNVSSPWRVLKVNIFFVISNFFVTQKHPKRSKLC